MRKERFSTRALAILLLFGPANYFLNLLIQEGIGRPISVSAVCYGCAFIVGAVSYFFLFEHGASAIPFFVVVFCAMGTLIFALFHPESWRYIYTTFTDLAYNRVIGLFFFCIPTFILCSSEHVDFEKLYKIALRISRVIIILLAVCYFGYGVGGRNMGGEYMDTAYAAMPAICFCLYNHMKSQKVISFDGVLGIIGVFITLLGGSRGALIFELLYIVILCLFSPSIKQSRKIIVISILVLFSIAISIYWNQILNWLLMIANNLGLQSRTISRLVDNSFLYASDRTRYWTTCMDATWNSPFLGYGMWGDRSIIGSYSHNLFVEFFCSYGLIFGSLLIVFLLYKIAKYVKNNINSQESNYSLFVIGIPYGLLQLMVSDSYLHNVWFFMILGIVLGSENRVRIVNPFPHKTK